jgi:hypothetical protein
MRFNNYLNEKSKKLYIDDIRDPKSSGFDIVRTSKEAINYIKKHGCPSYISFDHDLGGDDTAMIVVKWMVNKDLDSYGKFIPKNFKFNIHSANPVGAENIRSYLNNYIKQR